MKNFAIIMTFLAFWAASSICQAGCPCNRSRRKTKKVLKPAPVEKVLRKLKEKTEKLKSYQTRIEYLFRQPLFESKTLRTGVLYYSKYDRKSKLRVNFQTLKQDDEKQQKYVEQFIFDGVWLTHIDYQIKQVTKKQLVEPNEPVDAFELARRNFPIVGFTKVQELQKQFNTKLIELQQQRQEYSIRVSLQAKPDSQYKNDYKSIDFWLDKKSGLPGKIVAVTTEGDIYEIKLLTPKVNQKIEKDVFDFKIPKGFTIDEIPLEKSKKQ